MWGLLLLLALFLGLPLLFWIDYKQGQKEDKKKEDEIKAWLESEKNKQKYRISVKVKGKEEPYLSTHVEPQYTPYYLFSLGYIKITSYDGAANWADRLANGGSYRHFTDVFVPHQEIEEVKVVY